MSDLVTIPQSPSPMPVEPEFRTRGTPGPVETHSRLTSTSFICLLIVQFLTVLNDHTFRWLVVPLAKRLFRHQPGEASLGEDATMLALGLAAFTLPFLFLTAPAGYLADRFSKAKVITACKFAEIVIMLIGFVSLGSRNIPLLFVVVGLTGVMNALFAPARQGSIPELVHDGLLSKANGLMGLMNVVPCALGFLAGNALANLVQPKATDVITWQALMPAFGFVMTAAVLGWLLSLWIRRVPAADETAPIPWNFAGDTVSSLKILYSDVLLSRTALGISFFWLLASLAQLNIDTFGIYDLRLQQWQIGIFGMVLVLGVGLGSILAGFLSGGHVELGLVPVGAVGIAIASVVLYFAGVLSEDHHKVAFEMSVASLLFLGLFAGLFDVPLEAFLQHHSDPKTLGKVLAATNFLAFSGALAAAGIFYLLLGVFQFSPGIVFLIAGIGTIPIAVYIVMLLPGATLRLLMIIFSKTFYRVRRYGLENLPPTGGALLVSNHVSWIDGILLMTTTPRPVRFMAYADYVEHPRLNWLARIFEVIPIKANSGPKALMQSIRTAREAIEQGHVVCIFAEGTLTRTGQMQPFQPGFIRIIQGTNAPVIPVYLDGLWGSIFSFRGGLFFWKWPHRWIMPIRILYGKPILEPKNVEEVRSAVQELGVDAVTKQENKAPRLPRMLMKSCKQSLRRRRVSDSLGTELTGGRLLAGVLALRRVLLREVLQPDEQMVGLLLPPSVGGVLANLAVTFSKRVTVNLNYTLSDEDLEYCIRQSGLKRIITSKKMLERRDFKFSVPVILLEDLRAKVTGLDRAVAAAGAFATPVRVLETMMGLRKIKPDDLLTVIFTSGSTAEPKGVMLSHQNVRSNVDSIDQLFQLDANDCVLGILPFFHSFGYSATLWLPLTLPAGVVYHYNPLDARQIGKLAQKYGVTIILSSPTFLRSYLKRCEKEDFAKLDLCVVGAEKLPADLSVKFQEKFGVAPIEGYGCTELSPFASVNVPDHRCSMVEQKGTKPGSVGRPIPHVAAKIVDPETRQPLGTDQEGLLLIKGPNVMLGYLNQPGKTAQVIQDGWYNTGDIARIDGEGFIHITGRVSRFSKIAGEMVPHGRVEERLTEIVDAAGGGEEGEIRLAVTSVPDEQKGERLVVLHAPLPLAVPELLKKLEGAGLPNLWQPGADSFVPVERVPILGTGKLDLKAVKQLALEHFAKA